MTDRTTISSRDGLSLEAAVDAPENPSGALVLCHPHPKMGGTMEAPLLAALAQRMVASGWAVLRFNFRGIGASEGEPSTGEAEMADAEGALDEARRRWSGVPTALAGWSFGAVVALRAATADGDVVGCAAIAPSVVPKEGVTIGLPEPAGLHTSVPLLLVCGANDHLVASDGCRDWGAIVGAEVEVMKGANHFFWGKYDALSEVVSTWLGRKRDEKRSKA